MLRKTFASQDGTVSLIDSLVSLRSMHAMPVDDLRDVTLTV